MCVPGIAHFFANYVTVYVRRFCSGETVSLKLALSVGLSIALLPSSLQAQERVGFSEQLYWVTSGAWAPDGDLLLADVLAESVVRVSRAGEMEVQRIFDADTTGSGKPRPSFLHVDSAGNLFLEDKRSRAIRIASINNFLGVENQTDLNQASRDFENGEAVLKTIYDWQPVKDGFVAYADLDYPDMRGPGQFKSAFVYFGADDLKEIIGRTMDGLSDVRNHYLRNMPYIASLNGGEDVFILQMEEVPSILRLRLSKGAVLEKEELRGFPEGFRTCPKLERKPEWIRARQGARQATAFYKKIQDSRMAAGLYAWGGKLFLAAKDAIAPSEKTEWWMIELDPSTGSEVRRVLLPTAAAHVTIVPGDEDFAVIEKGRVEGLGRFGAPFMPISSMVLIPADRF